nr:lymphocyte antigen 6 complex locus protein G6d isoform X2 [Oryctolagus cuniculus]
MNPQLLWILLGTLLGAALGNRMRCYHCGGSGPSSSCKETVTVTCDEGERCGFLDRKPQPGLGQVKISGNRRNSTEVVSFPVPEVTSVVVTQGYKQKAGLEEEQLGLKPAPIWDASAAGRGLFQFLFFFKMYFILIFNYFF